MLSVEDLKFKKQKHFPFLKQFKKKFPITDETIFVYIDTIYSNGQMPFDIVVHELKHLSQQAKVGAKAWINQYLLDDHFRLNQEIEAYKHQLRWIKNEAKSREDYAVVLTEAANHISSNLYGNLITYPEAIKKLKV